MKYLKRCDHCKKKGHIKEECFKINGTPEWFKNLKGKESGRFAANVKKEDFEYEQEEPLGKIATESGKDVKPNSKLMNAIAQEVMKMFNAQQQTGTSNGSGGKMANFAGMISVSNVLVFNQENNKNTWIVDSGASDHMCRNKSLFHDFRNLRKPVGVGLPDGSMKLVRNVGNVRISDKLLLYDVLYIPDFKHNLLSVSKQACTKYRSECLV